MANVLLQQQSFLRVCPSSSPNLSGQLLKLEERCTLHSLLCSLSTELEKNALILAKPCYREKNIIVQIKQFYKKIMYLVLLLKNVIRNGLYCMCILQCCMNPLWCTGQEGMEEVIFSIIFLRKTKALIVLWPFTVHELLNYLFIHLSCRAGRASSK